MIRVLSAFVIAITFGLGGAVNAQTKAMTLLSAKKTGSNQKPSAVGTYARGCLAGGVELAENGPTWQAMRLSRNHNWGHPATIDFIEELSAKVASQVDGWKGLYVGDIGPPRGGPNPGHRSHQIGLDVDFWMLPPRQLRLSRMDRENLSSISIRSADQRSLNSNWTPQHMQVLKLTAEDPRVDRIFVTAPAKIYMCNRAKGNRKWLQKIRPLWGHHYHFHVRLRCPKGSRGCQTQTPSVAELSKGKVGCDETLNWWVTDALDPPKPDPNAKKKKPATKRKHPRDYTMAELPKACSKVLEN